MRRHLFIIGALALISALRRPAWPAAWGRTWRPSSRSTRARGRWAWAARSRGWLTTRCASSTTRRACSSLEGSEIHINTRQLAGGALLPASELRVPAQLLCRASSRQLVRHADEPRSDEKTEYYDPDSEFGIGTVENRRCRRHGVGAVYCWEFGEHLSVGATFRWYHLGMADAFCEGMCGDIGVLYDTPFRNLRLGASVMNLGPTNRWARTRFRDRLR